MKSTGEVAAMIVCMLAEESDEQERLSFYDHEDYMRYTEKIASMLDDFLSEGGGICC